MQSTPLTPATCLTQSPSYPVAYGGEPAIGTERYRGKPSFRAGRSRYPGGNPVSQG